METYTLQPVAFEHDGLTVRGRLYLPAAANGETAGQGPFPLVVISHGFGGNMGSANAGFGVHFAQAGFAACAFDFCGGRGSTSDGAPAMRSVLTEAADLSCVLDGLLARGEIDARNVFLFGMSEGGLVSTYVAASRPDDVRALALLYPAYCIGDDARVRMAAFGNPEEAEIRGVTIGRAYNEDAASFDIYRMMPRYAGPVLIQHGTADSLVDIAYSRRAVATFAHAELVEVEGAEHGFREPASLRETAACRAAAFFRESLFRA